VVQRFEVFRVEEELLDEPGGYNVQFVL
jgi:hypothetical protein